MARAALAVTVGVLFVSAQAQIWFSSPMYDVGGRPLHALLAAGLTLPLLAARRWPLPVLLVVLATAAGDFTLGGGLGQPWFAVLLATYALGAHASVGSSGIGLGVLAGLVLAVDVPRLRDGAPLDEVLPAWFVLAATWALGRWMRHRRDELTRLTEQARQLERERDAATAAAVDDERARIARELHDLVAHSLAVVVLQAQAAARVLDSDPGAARGALGAVESTGRAGLAELRRMLDLLAAGPDDLDPRPGLHQLDALVERVTHAGLPVTVSVEGQPRALPAGLDLSAYRIVQEALTNSLKHAGGSPARVELTYRPDTVEITVSDRGTTAPATNGVPRSGQGRGLIGMRERAALYGGRVQAGPLPGGGFAVSATLPTEQS